MYSDVKSSGANLVAISPQLPRYSKQIVKKSELTFPVLADIGNRVATSFGLTFTLPTELQEIYSAFGIDVPRFNGDDSWQLPMSGRFVIDQEGVIRSTEVHPDYTQRPEPTDILTILKSI